MPPIATNHPEKVKEYNLYHHGIETMSKCTHFAHIVGDKVYVYDRRQMISHIDDNNFAEYVSKTGAFKAVPIPDFALRITLVPEIFINHPAPDFDSDGKWAARVFLDMLWIIKDKAGIWLAGEYTTRKAQFENGDIYICSYYKFSNVELKTDKTAAKTGNLCVPIYEKRMADNSLDHEYTRR